jgi:hypothetical protein
MAPGTLMPELETSPTPKDIKNINTSPTIDTEEITLLPSPFPDLLRYTVLR